MSITRVAYREGQRLTTADLVAEQEYRLGVAGRHHLSHHEWGVVRGLRVVRNHAGGFTLTPGVAIDGYGREILVTAPLDLDIPDAKLCWFVILYYCEYPEQVPPGRSCKDEPAPRIAQRARAVVSEQFVTPAPFDDLEHARAAGKPAGLRPWPVVVARVGMGCAEESRTLVDYSLTHYVWHRAALVRSPTDRARVKLGLDSLTDIYPFLISTIDGAALAKRVGIDRDGTTHVWRPLVVSGAQAFGEVAIAEHQLLQVTMPMPAGIGSRLRMSGVIDRTKHVLSASLAGFGAAGRASRIAVDAAHTIKVTRPLDATLTFPNRAAALFTLVDPASLTPIALDDRHSRAKKRKGGGPEPTDLHRFSVDLNPTGGTLTLMRADRHVEQTAIACGDVDRSRADAGEDGAPVVQFRPAAAYADVATAREIYAVTTSAPTDLVPRTELRMSGGAEDKTDVGIRWCAGAWRPVAGPPSPAFIRRVQMDGARRIDILSDDAASAALDVKRTVYLPAIGKDDPLMPEMMAMAFIAGLRQLGRVATSTSVTLSAPGGATSVTRGSTLKYDAQIHYPNEHVLRRSIETIRGTAGTGDLAFRSMTEIVLPAGTSKTFNIEVKNFRHSARAVDIQVVLLVTESNTPRLAISNVLHLDVHS